MESIVVRGAPSGKLFSRRTQAAWTFAQYLVKLERSRTVNFFVERFAPPKTTRSFGMTNRWSQQLSHMFDCESWAVCKNLVIFRQLLGEFRRVSRHLTSLVRKVVRFWLRAAALLALDVSSSEVQGSSLEVGSLFCRRQFFASSVIRQVLEWSFLPGPATGLAKFCCPAFVALARASWHLKSLVARELGPRASWRSAREVKNVFLISFTSRRPCLTLACGWSVSMKLAFFNLSKMLRLVVIRECLRSILMGGRVCERFRAIIFPPQIKCHLRRRWKKL